MTVNKSLNPLLMNYVLMEICSSHFRCISDEEDYCISSKLKTGRGKSVLEASGKFKCKSVPSRTVTVKINIKDSQTYDCLWAFNKIVQFYQTDGHWPFRVFHIGGRHISLSASDLPATYKRCSLNPLLLSTKQPALKKKFSLARHSASGNTGSRKCFSRLEPS